MNRCLKRILSAQLNILALGLLALSAPAAQPAAVPANLPLFFEAGQGQAANPAQFIARGHDCQFLISPAEAQIVLRKTAGAVAAVRMQFAGASAQAQISGDTALPGKINYLTGNDPAQWRTGVATFAKVRVGELYPGINLVYYGNQQQLEYDFTVAPGAKPDAIAIHFDGVDKVAISKQGELVLTLGDAEIRQPKPVIYQTVGGARHEINGGYRLVDARTVAFDVGQYDRTLPLVIDPILSYSTYFGGNAGDTAWAVALDTNSCIYITGETFSKQFATTNAFQTNYQGGTYAGDAFVAKFDNLGTNLFYLTYLGGSGNDRATAIAVDNSGNAYVAGYTDSPNFPTTNALYKNISGTLNPHLGFYPVDAFVAEINTNGSKLVYSTYLGGSQQDGANSIALDSSNNVYVTGFTFSTDFPITNAIHYRLAGRTNTVLDHLACTNSVYYNANAFIAKIGAGGTNLVYSSYFGGNNYDMGNGIAVDSSNFVYVTGFTASTNFPTTNAAVQPLVWTNVVVTQQSTNYISITNYLWNGYLLNGATNQTSSYDAFVAKFDSTGTNLIYSTLLGGTNNDVAYSIAVDNQGAAYVTGWTTSTNFPDTNAIANLYSGVTDILNVNLATNVFLTKITNVPGTNAIIACSTLFGGTNIDVGYGVAVAAGYVFVTGAASSTDFPTFNVPGLMCATNSGGNDAFVAAFDMNTFDPVYSVFLGGASDDFGYGIAVDSLGNAYIVGQTLSINFPTFNARQTTLGGVSDGFLAEIILFVPLPVITTQPTNQAVAAGSLSVTFNVVATGTPPLSYQWQVNGTNLVDGGNISGSTNNALIINPAQTTNSGNYTVIVTNYGGSVTSSVAVLTVTNEPPVITTQPVSQTVGVGSSVTVYVAGNGTPPFFFQWLKNGTNLTDGTTISGSTISGSTNYYLTISNAQTNDDGGYSIIVTNIAGSVTSSVAVLTVALSPVIVMQPSNQVSAVGSNATFAVTAVGELPLSYQWRVNGTNLVNGGQVNGATNNVLTITGVQTNESGNSYQLIVTNFFGSVTSSVAVLTVATSPVIVMQPTNQAVTVGSNATFAVTAIGILPLSYQWRVNGTNLTDETNISGSIISGSTNHHLTISNAQTNDSGNYSVIVTNFAGSVTSSVAVLTVASSPVIVIQPTNQAVAVGSTATFAVTADGTAPLSYQWQVNGTNLVNGGQISGATTNVLTITGVQTNNSGNYTVIVTNIAGSVTSSNAVLTVITSPSFTSITAAGGSNGGFILSGGGGTNNGTYYVLTSSNLLVPLTNGRALRPINLTAMAISFSPTPRKPTRRSSSISCNCRDSTDTSFNPPIFQLATSVKSVFIFP